MKNVLVFIIGSEQVQDSFLKYSLGSSGIKNTVIIPSVEECIYSLRKSRHPDYIIADTAIRNSTDIEFLEIIKRADPLIKVIFYSENEDLSHISTLLQAGAADYIVKSGNNTAWMKELISNLQYLIKEKVSYR